MAVTRRPGSILPGWRVLGGTWVAVIVLAAAGAGALQALGPPAPRGSSAVPAAGTPTHEAGPAPTHPADATPAPPPRTPTVATPIAALLDPGGLPRIAPDGRTPRTSYAAPTVAIPDGVPAIALLVSGFGLSDRESSSALQSLPGPVAFAVSADIPAGSPLPDAARAAGHELLASIPMEPDGYPQANEGERSLLTTRTPAENSRNLAWALARTPGAVGATGASDGMRGERFAEVTADFDPVLAEIARRGLLYVDARPGRPAGQPGTAIRAVDVVLDDQVARAEIDAKLGALERTAKQRGAAIGLAGPLRPATIERIADWSKTLASRGFVLVPISQLVNAPIKPQ